MARGGEAAAGSCSPPAKMRRMRVALEPQCRVAKVQGELQGMKAEQLWAMFTVWGDHGARWAARVGLSEQLEEKHCEAFLESAAVEIPYTALVVGVRAYQRWKE